MRSPGLTTRATWQYDGVEDDRPTVLARLEGHCGELVLRQAGEHFEVIANGTFLMDTRNGESERLLVTAAADRMPGGSMLIGGLGVGFSLRAALDHPRVARVTVAEREQAVIGWNQGVLRGAHGDTLADRRTRCLAVDLLPWLRGSDERFDAVCVDIDNGPDWTVDGGNAELYTPEGVAQLAGHLTAGGVLAVWSAAASPAFEALLRTRFDVVEVLPVPVPRGEPDVVYLASG